MPARLARLPSPACHRPEIARNHGNLPASATHAGAPWTRRWQAGGGQVRGNGGQAPGVLHHVIVLKIKFLDDRSACLPWKGSESAR